MEDLKCINVQKMIKYYRSNDVSNLSPDEIELINLIRDLFVHADPLSVTATKRFETDEQMMEYYKNLQIKYQGNGTGKNGPHGIFDKSFVISPIMKSYADKFYKRRLNLASAHLSNVLKYQMATAITQNKPLPIVQNDVADEYLKLLCSKSIISANIKQLLHDHSNSRLNSCTNLFDNLVEDVLTGAHEGYFINNCLSEEMKAKVLKFRDDVSFLVQAPLHMSTNVFALIDAAAKKYGKLSTDTNRVENKRSDSQIAQTSAQLYATELAFENEALRRGLVQELNNVYETLSG
ncbi:GP41 [Mocis latipes granulovirus]|uniref:GP41 n=1 Tax=Mocis latipes granulovirus TaxID=2072024 RepID=A0A162GVZ9_9BBAC|nr:GP41 [Mocis latipes granulovirus]AKR17453.1 GP41 [Mocis latipes granulovirus]